MNNRPKSWALLCAMGFALALGGCKTDTTDSSPMTTVTGSAMAAHLQGASIVAYDTKGTVVSAPTQTSNGAFSLEILTSVLSSNLYIKASGGTYTDEATGTTTTLAENGLSVFVKANTLSATATAVNITPATTIVAVATENWSENHSSVTNLNTAYTAALAAFTSEFNYTPDNTVTPLVATEDQSDSSDSDAKLAGIKAAGFSQLTDDVIGSPSGQATMLKALGQDLSDGSIDGLFGTTTLSLSNGTMPLDMAKRYGDALVTFTASDRNLSGQTYAGMGNLPFSYTAYTDSYKVVYIPGSMSPMQGKSTFSLTITDLDGDALSTTPTISLAATMGMPTKTHATPVTGCTQSTTTKWSCTLYYLMASKSSSGNTGYWSLKPSITVSGAKETAIFYPTVSMSMTDTARVALKGVDDTITDMYGDVISRPYYLFKHTVTASSNTFAVFLSAQEKMMSFPAVTASTTLNDGGTYELAVSTVVVEASLDASTWYTMANNGSGVFSTTSLSLTADTEDDIYVRVLVNGEQKSTDGATASGTNAYGTFTITP
ncbi:MAG: hypothetical protein QNL04_15110 [SAR324 cluster bacterium]|nr:hypothetical protein [SAR324 cluster bacterium]